MLATETLHWGYSKAALENQGRQDYLGALQGVFVFRKRNEFALRVEISGPLSGQNQNWDCCLCHQLHLEWEALSTGQRADVSYYPAGSQLWGPGRSGPLPVFGRKRMQFGLQSTRYR